MLRELLAKMLSHSVALEGSSVSCRCFRSEPIKKPLRKNIKSQEHGIGSIGIMAIMGIMGIMGIRWFYFCVGGEVWSCAREGRLG